MFAFFNSLSISYKIGDVRAEIALAKHVLHDRPLLSLSLLNPKLFYILGVVIYCCSYPFIQTRKRLHMN